MIVGKNSLNPQRSLGFHSWRTQDVIYNPNFCEGPKIDFWLLNKQIAKIHSTLAYEVSLTYGRKYFDRHKSKSLTINYIKVINLKKIKIYF